MGYSLNDLKNAGESINRSLEENSRRKGEELALRIMGRKNSRESKSESARPEVEKNNKIGTGWGSSGW
jgi:hypothetical protein